MKPRMRDFLWDTLPTKQLKVAQGENMYEYTIKDTFLILKEMGSEYPKPFYHDGSLKYCQLAMGVADIAWTLAHGLYVKEDIRESIVDHAAGALLASEAGATVVDFNGEPIDWSHGRELTSRSILAFDPKMVDADGLQTAIDSATVQSEKDWEHFKEVRREQAETIRNMLKNMAQHAETPEELKRVKICQARGEKEFESDDAEVFNEAAQKYLHANEPDQFQEPGPEPIRDPFAGGNKNPYSPFNA